MLSQKEISVLLSPYSMQEIAKSLDGFKVTEVSHLVSHKNKKGGRK